MTKKKSIIISHGQRPLWHLIVAATFYTLSILIITSNIFSFKVTYLGFLIEKNWIEILYLLSFTLPIALRYSAMVYTYLDIDKNKIKKEYTLGFFRWGFWKSLPKIKYISIFKQSINKNH